ncbi:monovalent cation/H(+) antiporter subunit G [Sinanaerobacter sp. ZZT-01]|uniref:monovalent cation/H(+) antiporter subunit G n=1 Tax=Sinanaerobacter sp. ZZT-01 TaxID=3111540 RepID=UPI002D79F1C7|nr:monovalent cation/H(+) antiporter subunit G [Sinanaerobacter sp. ZZT-01]WRR94922.1 monovalent cation/H(+) antiporter subunit G [Sinanaerobacter sp. ZZT-01]
MQMYDIFWQFLICAFLIVGAVFCFGGSVGLLRFPDIYCRMQALSKPVTLGIFNLIVAYILFLYYTDLGFSLKGILAIVFLIITVPLGSHMMVKASYRSGIPMWKESMVDELEKWNKKMQ